MSFYLILIFFNFSFSYNIQIQTNEPFVIIDKNTSLLNYYKYVHNSFQIKYSAFFSYGLKKGDKTKEGDLKTPLGVYFVEKILSRFDLPKYFGSGALTLNYPNPIDILNKKTGSNIWIHGTENKDRLDLILASKGCIILENIDFIKLLKLIRVKYTPIIITDNLKNISFIYSKNIKIKVNNKDNFEVIVNKDKIEYKKVNK